MKENEKTLCGYSFSDVHDYKEAKREAETIEYIKANTDLKDINKVIKLYHKLVERKTLKTVIGTTFLKELQNRIIKESIMNPDNVPNIPIIKEENHPKVFASIIEHEQVEKHLEEIADYKIRLKNSRIISVFLTVIIVIMIVIAILSDRSVFERFENGIIDTYSTWEEELDAREKALDIREDKISQQENTD
ncbi:MAG: hypothetical protein WBI07_08730 [Mobilitalea sp.]